MSEWFLSGIVVPRREPSRGRRGTDPLRSGDRMMVGRQVEKGPEGSVVTEAEGRLQESAELAGCPIRCQFRDGTLTLWGQVPRYSVKQAARSAVQGIPGVLAIDNRIDVIPVPLSHGPDGQRRSSPAGDRLRTD
jgi:osmotically-inducible protein OsmY